MFALSSGSSFEVSIDGCGEWAPAELKEAPDPEEVSSGGYFAFKQYPGFVSFYPALPLSKRTNCGSPPPHQVCQQVYRLAIPFGESRVRNSVWDLPLGETTEGYSRGMRCGSAPCPLPRPLRSGCIPDQNHSKRSPHPSVRHLPAPQARFNNVRLAECSSFKSGVQ